MSRWYRSGDGVLRSALATSIRAAEALRLLRPLLTVPIHWGTYAPLGFGRLHTAVLTDTVTESRRHAAELAPEVEVRVLDLGGTLHLDAIAGGYPS